MVVAVDPINGLNLKLIQTFILVAQHQSFRHAAELTLRTQSAVSLQIKQLEEQLGVVLFHRTTRSVALTEDGQELFDGSIKALRLIDDSLRNINERADLRRGRVTIACSPTIASSYLAQVLRAFELDYPQVKIVVREQNPNDLFESVRSAEVDFAIGPVVNNPDFAFDVILDELLFAVVPANFGAFSGPKITVSDLSKLPLLLLNPASALRSTLNSAFTAAGVELTAKYEFSQAQTLISMATAGLGVAILPESVVRHIKDSNLQVLEIDHPNLSRKVAIITRRGHALTPASAQLAGRAHEVIGRHRVGAQGRS